MPIVELECPCCGDVGALSQPDETFQDGQDLICGCNGCVHVDDSVPDEIKAYVWTEDFELCPRCDAEEIEENQRREAWERHQDELRSERKDEEG